MSDATSDGHRYYRWAGFLLRAPEDGFAGAQILKAREWVAAPKEAISDVSELPEEHPPGGWCARLSTGEAQRMAAGFGVSL